MKWKINTILKLTIIFLTDDREVLLSYKILYDAFDILISFNDDLKKKEDVPTNFDSLTFCLLLNYFK